MAALSIDVTPILEVIGGDVEADVEYEITRLTVGDESFASRGPAAVHVTVTNTGAGFVASGDVVLPVTAQCARCLRDFDTEIRAEVEGFYVRHGHDADLPEDQEYGFVEDGAVDVGPAVEAALALEAPFAPLHAPDCKGLCARCGADLNDGACGCPAPDGRDGPFGALRSLAGDGVPEE